MLRRKTTQTLPSKPVEYPVGSFLRTDKSIYYIVAPGKRYRLITERCLDSWRPHRVIRTSEAALAKYKVTAKMKFRNGSLIYNLADAKMYLIESGKRRHILTPDALGRIGGVRSEAVVVGPDEIKLHEEGEPLS